MHYYYYIVGPPGRAGQPGRRPDSDHAQAGPGDERRPSEKEGP